jgi:hypothetical protein
LEGVSGDCGARKHASGFKLRHLALILSAELLRFEASGSIAAIAGDLRILPGLRALGRSTQLGSCGLERL